MIYKFLVLVVLLFFLVFSPTFSYNNISACDYITSADLDASRELRLNQSVNSSSTCFWFATENVTLNCQNYNITGNKTVSSSGLYFANDVSSNITISNCNVYNYDRGVYMWGPAENFSLTNILSTNNSREGFYLNLQGASTHTYQSLTATYNGNTGIVAGISNENATLSNVVANYNSHDGIELQTDHSKITAGTFNYNNHSGILITGNNNNTISGSQSSYNSQYGLEFFGGPGNNTIDNNDLRYNTLGSIYINHGNPTQNLFTRNYVGNTSEIVGADGDNYWNNSGWGNYYSDFNGSIPYCFGTGACDYFAGLSPASTSTSSASVFPLFSFTSILLSLFLTLAFLFY